MYADASENCVKAGFFFDTTDASIRNYDIRVNYNINSRFSYVYWAEKNGF